MLINTQFQLVSSLLQEEKIIYLVFKIHLVLFYFIYFLSLLFFNFIFVFHLFS